MVLILSERAKATVNGSLLPIYVDGYQEDLIHDTAKFKL